MSNRYLCPSWCREAEARPDHRGEIDWSEGDGEASRPHTTAAIQRTDGASPGSHGSTRGLRLDIGAEEVAPILAGGTRGPSVIEQPLIRIAMWVEMPHLINEVNYDMTASEARELAGSLRRAADQLDVINGWTGAD